MRQALWRAHLLDPDQYFYDHFSQPPQVLYKYIPAIRLDHALPDGKPCSFRATPPNQLNDMNETNFVTKFVDNEKNRDEINRGFALAMTKLFPISPISVENVESYRAKHAVRYGAELARDQLSKKYGVTSFSISRNNVQMWTHYADDCRGVVIGYNVDDWVNLLVGSSIFREVKYANTFPPILDPRVVSQENAYGLMCCKGVAWEHEKEWRLITELSKTREIEKGIAVITVPQISVSSVLITDRTPQDVVDTIVRRLNNPSNDYRIWRIDKMQSGHDPTTLASAGQMKTRAHKRGYPISPSQ